MSTLDTISGWPKDRLSEALGVLLSPGGHDVATTLAACRTIEQHSEDPGQRAKAREMRFLTETTQ